MLKRHVAALAVFLLPIAATPTDAARARAEVKQASVDLEAGRYPEAIRGSEDAAAAFGELSDPADQGRALTVSGLAKLYSGDFDGALATLERALELARSAGDTDGEIVRLNNIGTVYFSQGRYSEALQTFETAMARVNASPPVAPIAPRRQLTAANIAIVYQRLGRYQSALEQYARVRASGQALPPREQAQLLTNMGVLYRRLGDPVKALETYRAAQTLYKTAAHRDGEIAVLNNIGIVQALDFGSYAAAVRTFDEALRVAEQTGDKPLTVHARLYRGEALWRAGRIDDAAGDFTVALREARLLNAREDVWKALFGLARVEERRGDIAGSDGDLAESIQVIESLRSGLRAGSSRSEFLADKRDVYDLRIDHVASKPRPDLDLLFSLMEQSRSRLLQDRTATRLSLRRFMSELPQGALALEYWVSDRAAAVLWARGSSAGFRRWNITSQDIDALGALVAAVQDRNGRSWRDLARECARVWLRDVPLDGVSRLVVIPDGPLARVPFEVLPGSDGRLLLDRMSVSYEPTAPSIARHRRRVLFPWQRTVLALADPKAQPGSDPLGLTPDAQWEGLQGAANEATAVADEIGGRCEIHSGADAQKKYITQPAYKRPPILHLATHAFADLQDPERSYIVLASPVARRSFDYLFAREIAALNLTNVELATVSACDSGRGKLMRGEGVGSLSRAFLLAGAHATVTTLWRIGDRSTAELMRRFYSGLAAGQTKASALRNAKLAFRNSRAYSHPAYWAAFVLNGDGETPIPLVVPWSATVGVPLVFLGLVIAAFRIRVKKRAVPAQGDLCCHPREARAPGSVKSQRL